MDKGLLEMKIELENITVDLFEHDISHIKNVAVNCSPPTTFSLVALPPNEMLEASKMV